MSRTIGLLAVLASVASLAGTSSGACLTSKVRGKLKGSTMQTTVDRVLELLRQFSETEDVETLRKAFVALESMTSVSVSPVADFADATSQMTRRFLDVFNAIDSKRVANFNFDARPSITTAPPPESGLPAGVDPGSIADPTMRGRYVKDIAVDQQKLRTYKLQAELRRIDRDVTESFERHIQENCRLADRRKLEKLIDDAVHSKARRESLKSRLSALLRGGP